MQVTTDVTEAMAERFKLLGDPSRLAIVMAIHEPRSVGDIASHCSLSNSLVSHHLRLLRSADLARSERRGKQIFYQLSDEHVRHLLLDMFTHITECGDHADHNHEGDHHD